MPKIKKQMNRRELIFELKKYVRPTEMYHSVLTWPTKGLEMLLEWYKELEKVGIYDKKLNGIYNEVLY